MKRLWIYSTAIIIFLASCQTPTADDIRRPYLQEGYQLSGLEAAEYYRNAVTELPDPYLYYNLAYSYIEAEEYEKAIEAADEALVLYPDYLRFMYLKAYAYLESSRYYSYELMLQEILEKDPGNDEIRNLLLDYYISIRRRSDAVDLAKEVLEYDITNPDALRALASTSPFFAAIAPAETSEEEERTRLWSEPPFVYMPLRIMNGDRLLSRGESQP